MKKENKVLSWISWVFVIGLVIYFFPAFPESSQMELISYQNYDYPSQKKMYFYVFYDGKATKEAVQQSAGIFVGYFENNILRITPDVWNLVKEGKVSRDKAIESVHIVMTDICLRYSCYLILINDKSVIPEIMKLHEFNESMYQEKYSRNIVGRIPVVVRDGDFEFWQPHFFN
ncbi:MAG: hypothetical protein LBH40_00195 [Alphaproteobacteria bacterium]|jgi:hypothetical protein|nr:hypothetical protein [Alphaproteobacteria bacterium]